MGQADSRQTPRTRGLSALAPPPARPNCCEPSQNFSTPHEALDLTKQTVTSKIPHLLPSSKDGELLGENGELAGGYNEERYYGGEFAGILHLRGGARWALDDEITSGGTAASQNSTEDLDEGDNESGIRSATEDERKYEALASEKEKCLPCCQVKASFQLRK